MALNGGLSDRYRLLLATGFCGGFSTFSTFTGETLALWQQGRPETALLNIVASLAVCFVSLLLGIKLSS
jgi:CrcB protein